jgi:putative DNA primase/helicase
MDRGKLVHAGERAVKAAASKVPHIKFYSLEQATAAAWRALKRANDRKDHSEFLFRHGDRLCRLEFGDGGHLRPRILTRDRMRYRLSEGHVVKWEKESRPDGKVIYLKAAPTEVVANVLATPDPDLPIMNRIAEHPVLAPDGTVHDKPGYSGKSRVFLHPPSHLKVPKVRGRPTAGEVKRARNLIVRDVLGDFPFRGPQKGKAELAHAVCLFVQPFVRDLIKGPTPLYVVESPTPGTGKGLLVDACCLPALGSAVPINAAPESEDEWRKKITTLLIDSTPVIFFDNLGGSLSSKTLSAALTSTTWSDRRLGKNENVSVPNLASWVVAGNNPGLSKEIQRRGVRIRVDARMEHPEDRDSFRHDDLRGWIREHRGDLIWAALTLARAWVAKGQPRCQERMGSFEDWSAVMGGILDVVGIPGFLANTDPFRENAHSENIGMYEFLSDVRSSFGDTSFTTNELSNRLSQSIEQHFGIDTLKPNAMVKLGITLKDHRDRHYGDLMLVRVGAPGGVTRWSVQEAVEDGD